MKREEKIVLDSSDEAASIQTVTGWVSRDGRFYGNDESLARYAGSTHRTCECGAVTEKSYLRCKECRHKGDIAKYNAMPSQPWDGETFLYSDAHDKYFQDLESLADHLSDYDDDDKYTLEDLRLIICEPNYARQVESDFWCDELPEDGDIPAEMKAAMKAFNEVIKRQAPLSWSPGKFAADLASIKAMIGPVELFAEPLPAAPVQQEGEKP